MEEILEEKYRFIHDNVFLGAHVNTKTGKQHLTMEKRNTKTGEVEFSDAIECIHTAIVDISLEEFENIGLFDGERDDFYRKSLNIMSSEDLYIIDLAPEEKFFALKSWVEGIAEAGKNAFQLETDIEVAGHLYYPIAGKLLLFMVRVDTDFIFDYVSRVERQCVFEGVKHMPSLMANAFPIIQLLNEDFINPVIKDRVKVIQALHSIVEFPLESVSSGARMIAYYIRDHPEYGVKYLIRVVKRECINKPINRAYMFKLLAPLCIVFFKLRFGKMTEIDVNFAKLILSLKPPLNWLRKHNLLSYFVKTRELFNF